MVPNLTDFRDLDAGDLAGNLFSFWRCEKQFIVFAAMERKLKISAFSDGDLARRYLRRYMAFLADVRQIHREAIAQVDHGGGEAVFSQPGSDFNPGRRIKVDIRLCWLNRLSRRKPSQDSR